MSRFRVIKSKGRFYVLTTDTKAVADGPFDAPDDADTAMDKLAALDARQTAAANQPVVHGMNITPGYRSPDVEDARGNAPPSDAAARLMPPGWVKWNTPNHQPPPPGWVPDWKKANVPVDPLDLPRLDYDEFGEWVTLPGTVRDVIHPPQAATPAPAPVAPATPPWGAQSGKPRKK